MNKKTMINQEERLYKCVGCGLDVPAKFMKTITQKENKCLFCAERVNEVKQSRERV